MKKEIWLPVKGYEELYAVSNLGRVKSLKFDKEKILKPAKRKDGYLQVVLCKNGKMKHFLIHRLVAEAFLPNPEGLPEVNHLNENKSNNVVSNIEWCSRSYNNNYGTRTKRQAASQSKAVEASKYEDFSEIELRFPSTQEAGRNGYNQSNVSACCNGCYCSEGNFYKGLYWRFASVGKSEYNIMQERQILIFMNVINNFKEKCLF